MTKSKPKTPRTRRASVTITESARVEIHAVADAFGLPVKAVRETAGEVASEAIHGELRARLGASRLEAAKAELARLQREMGGEAREGQREGPLADD